MKTQLMALATAHNMAGEEKKTALLRNLERDWEEYIIAPFYNEDAEDWSGNGQYLLKQTARDALTAYICYLDHDNFAVDSWTEKTDNGRTIIHQAVKFYNNF